MNENAKEDWEKTEVETTKPVGTVISVRFRPELAERLMEEAERRSVSTSAVVREAVEAFFSEAWSTPASFVLTISSADAPVALYHGRSRQARTAGIDVELVAAKAE